MQGSIHGALLIDGSLACPLIPDRLATAPTDLDDTATRTPSQEFTLHPGDLGHLDKFRQDLPYLSPSWRGTYSAARAMTEGAEQPPQGHDLDLGDPKNRLAHGRVAQTILAALLVTVANDHFLDQWRHTHQPPDEPDTPADILQIPAEHIDRTPLTGRSIWWASAVPSRSAVAYLIIWSYWLAINSQSMVLPDRTPSSCGQASPSVRPGRYRRTEPMFFSRGSSLKSSKCEKAKPTIEAPCVSPTVGSRKSWNFLICARWYSIVRPDQS